MFIAFRFYLASSSGLGFEGCFKANLKEGQGKGFKQQSRTTTTSEMFYYLGVSKNNGTPKSSNLVGFSIINYKPSILGYNYFWNHPFKLTV